MIDPETYGTAEITSQERAALTRLQDNKDFVVLTEILQRQLGREGYKLLLFPNQNQDYDLILAQGGSQFFKRMLKTVNESETPPGGAGLATAENGAGIGGARIKRPK